MIFTRIGSGIIYNGTLYAVGMKVAAVSESDYAGLYGVINEIRTGEDRETENDAPDIECCFDPPMLKEEVTALEARFSALYQQPKTVDELALDMVIMTPEELKPIDSLPNAAISIYVVMNEWEDDDGPGHSESYFTDYDAAKRQFNDDLLEDHTNGVYAYWHDEPDFTEESEPDFYCCKMENSHTYHHFALRIEKQQLPLSPAFTAEVAKHHASHTHLANLCSLLPKDSILPAPAGELENLKQKLAKALDQSEPCSDAYWETLQPLVDELKEKLNAEV